MKEATGELNMTVITVVAIAAIGGFFTIFIWPSIKASITNNTNCANAICKNCAATADTCTCKYIDDAGAAQDIECKNPNKD